MQKSWCHTANGMIGRSESVHAQMHANICNILQLVNILDPQGLHPLAKVDFGQICDLPTVGINLAF